MSTKLLCLAILCTFGFVQLVSCEGQVYKHSRSRDIDVLDSPTENKFHYEPRDLDTAGTGHYGHGRVHIKVYRGPSDGHHAPHGYWVKQPADD